MPEKLQAALEAFIDRTSPKPGKSAVMRAALEEYLAKHNLWPPAGEGEE